MAANVQSLSGSMSSLANRREWQNPAFEQRPNNYHCFCTRDESVAHVWGLHLSLCVCCGGRGTEGEWRLSVLLFCLSSNLHFKVVWASPLTFLPFHPHPPRWLPLAEKPQMIFCRSVCLLIRLSPLLSDSLPRCFSSSRNCWTAVVWELFVEKKTVFSPMWVSVRNVTVGQRRNRTSLASYCMRCFDISLS